jgi:hypothetical protein
MQSAFVPSCAGLLLLALPAPLFAQAPAAPSGADPIVGRWKVRKEVWVFHADGTMTRSKPNFHEKGKWSKNAEGKYELNWSRGRLTNEIRLENDKLVDRNKQGKSVDFGERAQK